MRWSLTEVTALTGGRLLTTEPGRGKEINAVTHDSRQCGPGTLFVPLKGARDGHDFIGHAVRAGASAYLTSQPTTYDIKSEHSSPTSAIAVDDTQQALTALACQARRRLPTTPVVGVTGSVGKTTTKDLLASVLGRDRRVHVSAHSFNNEIGLPLSLLATPDDAEVLVLEMGSRGIGQIRDLCNIACPTAGVITTVGLAHTSEFGSLEAVVRAKRELVESLPAAADGGVAFLNAGVAEVAGMATHTAARVVTYGMIHNRAGKVGSGTGFKSMSDARSVAEPDVTARDVRLGDDLTTRFTLVSNLSGHVISRMKGGPIKGMKGGPAVIGDVPNNPPSAMPTVPPIGMLIVPPRGLSTVSPTDVPTQTSRNVHSGSSTGELAVPLSGVLIEAGEVEVVLGARGLHAVDNALAAAAVGLVLGMSLNDVAAGLAEPVLSPLRMELLRLPGGAQVINDSYNANPMSMRAALQSLAALRSDRCLAVLGVMAELGDYSLQSHADVASLAADLGIHIIAVNAPDYSPSTVTSIYKDEAAKYKDEAAKEREQAVTHVSSIDAALEALIDFGGLNPGTSVLVKGSRVAGLERLVKRLETGKYT